MTHPFHDNGIDMTRQAASAAPKGRLHALLERFSTVRQGADLLKLADLHSIPIALSDQLPENFNGGYRNGGVELNRKTQESSQLATLAHELRHLWQECHGLSPTHERCGARIDSYPVRDPFTYFISVRLREADAFAFEAEYIRDYTEKTGDTKPAELMMRQYPEAYGAYAATMGETCGDRKAARQAAFLAFFGHPSQRYDSQTLDGLERILAEQKMLLRDQPMRMQRLMSAKSPFRLTASTVRKFGDMGNGENYFSDISDSQLIGKAFLGEINPQTKERLDKITQRYREFFDTLDARPRPAATGRIAP